MTVSTSTRKLFSKCRVLGQGAQKIALSESEMFALMHVSCQDLKWNPHDVGLPTLLSAPPDEQYYRRSDNLFGVSHHFGHYEDNTYCVLAYSVLHFAYCVRRMP